ncbi:MAG: tetratricopeptide repeat protein, partial [Thermoanaerobaculia bacterium]
ALAAALAAAFVAGALLLPRLTSSREELAADPPARRFPFSDVSAHEAPELEARFAAEPASLETGAHLAMALAKGGRVAEARLLLPRLRQIPGRAADPLVDYVEGSLAVAADEPQLALVMFGKALERARTGGRGELLSQIRAARGHLLSTLGRGDEALADMQAALAGFESSHDAPSLARVLNDLAVEELQRGRLAQGERLLERALEASREANPGGTGGGVILGNLAGISMLRGRPDEAAPRCRETIRTFRDNGSHRLAWALTDCSVILRDLALTGEADASLAEALALLASSPAESDFAIALSYRGDAELASGERNRAAATAAEIERAASAGGDRPALARADRLRAGLAAQQGHLATARRLFAEARTLEAGSGQEDAATEIDLEAARIELEFGELAAAETLVAQVAASAAGSVREGSAAFFSEILRAEIDLREGRIAEAGVRLKGLGDPDRLTSLARRLALLAARGHQAASAGQIDAARVDLDRAQREAAAAHLSVEALERRLDLARLEEAAALSANPAERRPPATRSRERQQIVDEAGRLGLTRLARRAADA